MVDETVYLDKAVSVSGRSAGFRPYRDFGKRLFDILFVVAMLPLVVPILLVALVIGQMTGGQPFFSQVRVGRDGRHFKCLKIRTMARDANVILARILAEDPVRAAEWARDRKLADDPRITRFGHLLRQTSLDELPQVWNVLAGHMSVVGPRPVVPDELELYGAGRDDYLAVRPGVTGMWQVSGRNDISYSRRVALDRTYVRNLSLGLDIWIMLQTIRVMLLRTGK